VAEGLAYRCVEVERERERMRQYESIVSENVVGKEAAWGEVEGRTSLEARDLNVLYMVSIPYRGH